MREDIKERIEQIKQGEIPIGYKYTHFYICPEDWNTCAFKDKFTRLTEKNSENNQNVLTISAQQGLISQNEYYNHSYASEDKSGYSLLRQGDFSYNKSYSGDYPYGAIKRLDKFDEGIVSPLYICFTGKNNTNSDYYLHYFEAGAFNREIYKIAQEGARNHGLLNVSVVEFFESYLLNPPTKEQQKIAEILNHCDKVIELKQQLIEEERNRKKWLTQNLLDPDSGVRLPGFKDKCKVSNISNLCEIRGGGTPSTDEEQYWQGDIPWISSTDIVEGDIYKVLPTRYITQEAITNSATQLCPKDSILIVSRVGVGKLAIAPFALCTSQDFTNIVNVKGNVVFLALSIQGILSKLKTQVQGTSIKGITVAEIKRIKLSLPTIEEQNLIAKIISSADIKIDLLEQELTQWQQKKKALMQLLLTGIVRVST